MFLWAVADDLTGANEVGACFAQAGLPSLITLDTKSVKSEGAVICTIESRHLPPEQARAVAAEEATRLAQRPDMVFKKIDSTLRGNIGAEIEATLSALNLEGAVLASALPSQGRTTIGGYQLISGVPVNFTPIRHDPLSPVDEAHIPTILERHTSLDTIAIPVDIVDKGQAALLKAIRQQAHEHRVFVIDAVTDQHLAIVAAATYKLRATHLAVGTSGLARELAWLVKQQFPDSDRYTPTLIETSANILFVCGSLNPVALTQAIQLSQAPGVLSHSLNPDENSKTRHTEAKEISSLLRNSHVIIHPRRTPGEPSEITDSLARMTTEIIEEVKPGGIFITGGETAHAVLSRVGAKAIIPVSEVMNGIPAGYICGGKGNGIPLVTKAGGFGHPDDLTKVLQYFHQLIS